jgi:hypothetical protein
MHRFADEDVALEFNWGDVRGDRVPLAPVSQK